ncbi:MAG: ArsA-related P-loop ATPase [Pseudomonadota bacterium]
MASHATLHLISGKGGVGKTYVAAALARQFAARGDRTLLVSFDPVGHRHPLFDRVLAYEPASVGEHLSLSCVDAREALLEYVRRRMSFSLVYETALKNPLVGRFLTALPIFEELMCLGKLYDLTTDPGSPYDRVVFDAPATGHCQILLNIPGVAADTLLAGPVHRSALQIQAMLQNPEITELLIVTLAEETPVREAAMLARYARETARVRVPALLVNRLVPQRFAGAGGLAIVERLRDAPMGDEIALAHAAVTLERSIAAEQADQVEALRAVIEADTQRIIELPEVIAEEDSPFMAALETVAS